MCIRDRDHAYQLCSKPEMYEYLIRIAKQPKKYVLTDVMLETLSIIAYRQPITKLEIEKIRGVKSDHAVNKLIEYNLVCELGRLDAPVSYTHLIRSGFASLIAKSSSSFSFP